MGVKTIEYQRAAVEKLYSTVCGVVEFVGGRRMGIIGREDCIVSEGGNEV